MSRVNKLVQRLSKGPILGAEGYLFELERRGWVSIGPFVPEVVIEEPSAVAQLHREFVRAGSDVIEAFTFYGHREKLKLINKEHILQDLNINAIQIAFDVRNEFYKRYPNIYNTNSIENEILVAGNICTSTKYNGIDNTSNEDINNIKYMFEEQIQWATEMNVDFIIGETFDYYNEALLAINAIKTVDSNMPCLINLAIHGGGTTLDGYKPEDALLNIYNQGADIVGLNCERGPDTMLPLLKDIKNKLDINKIPIAALPVCYKTNDKYPTFQSLSENKDQIYTDLDDHQCTRYDIYNFTKQCLDLGVQYLGMFFA